jgi:hypothetical protein
MRATSVDAVTMVPLLLTLVAEDARVNVMLGSTVWLFAKSNSKE